MSEEHPTPSPERRRYIHHPGSPTLTEALTGSRFPWAPVAAVLITVLTTAIGTILYTHDQELDEVKVIAHDFETHTQTSAIWITRIEEMIQHQTRDKADMMRVFSGLEQVKEDIQEIEERGVDDRFRMSDWHARAKVLDQRFTTMDDAMHLHLDVIEGKFEQIEETHQIRCKNIERRIENLERAMRGEREPPQE